MAFPITRWLKWDLRPPSEGVTSYVVRVTGQPDFSVAATTNAVPVTISGPGNIVGAVAAVNEFGEGESVAAIFGAMPPGGVTNLRFEATA